MIIMRVCVLCDWLYGVLEKYIFLPKPESRTTKEQKQIVWTVFLRTIFILQGRKEKNKSGHKFILNTQRTSNNYYTSTNLIDLARI